MTSPWTLPFSALNTNAFCSSPLITLMALLLTNSKSSTPFLCWGPQAWTWYSEWDLKKRHSRAGTIPLPLPAGHPSFDATQGTVGKLYPNSSWLFSPGHHWGGERALVSTAPGVSQGKRFFWALES